MYSLVAGLSTSVLSRISDDVAALRLSQKEVSEHVQALRSSQPFTDVLIKDVLRPNSKAKSEGRNSLFRRKLEKHYGNICSEDNNMKLCMVLNTPVPSRCLRAAHIFPVRLRRYLRQIGLTNVNTKSNGLLWCDALEEAYEAWALGIGCDEVGDFVIVVIDKRWEDKTLKCVSKEKDEGYLKALGEIKFGQLQGRKLTFLNRERPSRRCCLFMGQLMVDLALERKCLSSTANIDCLDVARMSEWEGRDRHELWLKDANRISFPLGPMDET